MLYQKNGHLIKDDQVSLEDRAFMYGDGCFSTARLQQGRIQLWQRHLDRFEQAISALHLQCTLERIQQEASMFLAHLHNIEWGTVKILISRGTSARGYALPARGCDIYFYYYPASKVLCPSTVERVDLLPETLGTTMEALKGIKTLNRLEQVILKASATNLDLLEGLCLDQQGNLVESISSNCFFYIDKKWVTPDLALSGIRGTMRQEILDRMKHYQIDHQVRIISPSELEHTEAAFLCNALQPMQMLHYIAQKQLTLQPCQNLFNTLSLHQLV